MKKLVFLTLLASALSCGRPEQYLFELNGEIVEGPSADEGTTSIDMYQDMCDAEAEVFTSALFNLTVLPLIVNEPGQAEIANDLYVKLDTVRIVYTERPNALGNSGAPIAEMTLTDVSNRDLKVGAENETAFLFVSLDQKDQWREDQAPETGEVYLYDYTMTLTFIIDEDGNEQQEEFTGTFEVGHFDKCD